MFFHCSVFFPSHPTNSSWLHGLPFDSYPILTLSIASNISMHFCQREMPMNQHRCRKCQHCGESFQPNPRTGNRQKYCSKPECRKASRAASQRQWLSKPENHDYFKGPENTQRVREWRKEHPEHWKRKKALQDSLHSQNTENKNKLPNTVASPLQDVFAVQLPIFVGLIAMLTGSTLQDDIAQTAKHLMEFGLDILAGHGHTQSSNKPKT